MSTLFTTQRPRALRPARPGVPWKTVLTLAVAMSCTGAFWLVSLQGAIGATARGESPFATWLMLSLTLVPMYAVAVLGAITLAKRWFGPEVRGSRRVLTTGLLVVLAGTLAGIAAIVASSAYDYSIQVMHIGDGMAPCTGSCVPREQHDIFVLHVRGALLVGRWLVLTNLVLVAWLTALWGGRIKVATRPSADSDGAMESQIPVAGSLRSNVRLLLAGTLAGSAVIHAAVIPEHLDEWPIAGQFFAVLTAAELVVAGLLVAGFGRRRLLVATAAVSVVPLTAWLWSRTLGLPFGPESGFAEAVGVPDVLACVLEICALLAALALLDRDRLVRPPLSVHTKSLAALALVAATAIGFAATGQAWFDAFGVAASQTGMEMSG